jgi:hypothetical protein
MFFVDMTVDHILPRSLLDDPKRKTLVLADFDLPKNFDIESYNNWLPCHNGENRQKGSTIFPKQITLYYIGNASDKSEKARSIEDEWRKSKRSDNILIELQVALINKNISPNQVNQVVDNYQQGVTHEPSVEISLEPSITVPNEPIVITFGLTIENVYEHETYDKELLSNYSGLCDQLEIDLVMQLSSIVSSNFFICEDSRDGESLSVRIAFENLNPEEIKMFISDIWEILEVKWFFEIYDE